ncbi:MAG: DUF3368 domain-containing protein [Blastocatellia bacterium]
MLNERVVINASPLITLCKSGQEELLPRLFGEIIVPDGVWKEIMGGNAADPAAQRLRDPAAFSWCQKEPGITIPSLIQAWDLGAGESEVLAFAMSHPDYLAVIDDAAGRRCARSLNIRVSGTVGLLILAKRRGVIDTVMPGIQALRQAGLWMDDSLTEEIRRQMREWGTKGNRQRFVSINGLDAQATRAGCATVTTAPPLSWTDMQKGAARNQWSAPRLFVRVSRLTAIIPVLPRFLLRWFRVHCRRFHRRPRGRCVRCGGRIASR